MYVICEKRPIVAAKIIRYDMIGYGTMGWLFSLPHGMQNRKLTKSELKKINQ